MMSIRTIILCVIIFGLNASCSDDTPSKPFQFTEAFTGKNSKTWRLTKLVGRKTGKKEVTFGLDLCERDDQYTFYANEEKLFEVKNANFACDGDPEDPLLVSYTWEFNNSGATLSMVLPHVFGYFFIPFIVKKVTAEEMELEIFVDEPGTESYVLFFSKVGEN